MMTFRIGSQLFIKSLPHRINYSTIHNKKFSFCISRNVLPSKLLLENGRQFSTSKFVFNELTNSNEGSKISSEPLGDAAFQENSSNDLLNSSEIATTSDPVGFIASYISFFETISSSGPVIQGMSCLRSFHDFTGLPWWGSIIVSTVLLRTTITFPLAVYQQYIMAKVELLKDEMMKIMQQLAHETRVAKEKYNWDEKKARQVFKLSNRAQWRRLIERDNCHPAKGVILVLAQLPLWVTLSLGYRNLCTAKPIKDIIAERTFYELYSQGTIWCPHLTHPDPVIVLPLMMALINLTITEIHNLQRPQSDETRQKILNNFFRFVAVMTFPIAVFMPSGVVLYWVTSSGCALVQTLLLLHPKVKEACWIPFTPTTHMEPYKRMVLLLKEKIDNSKLPPKIKDKADDLPSKKKS